MLTTDDMYKQFARSQADLSCPVCRDSVCQDSVKEHVLNTYAREDLDLKDSARIGFAKKKDAEDKGRTRVQHKQSVIMAL